LPPPADLKAPTLVLTSGDHRASDFGKHMDETNVDFKENIMKKVEMIKLKDTAELQKRVDDVKKEEQVACEKLNKEYQKREDREQHIVDKTKQKKELLMNIVAQWETQRKKRAILGAFKSRWATKKKDREDGHYLNEFY